ncbi:sensor histidine kinase [Winogradskyella sp. DF17]|uniref:Sensor histidine kinase n=1 Tax=Winogradskyella pelagia TaxID=2819984 RepID=A0ABS3T143_9FLAO|nr:sensor histidine kinase [Winogradskyella sp. DF17]
MKTRNVHRPLLFHSVLWILAFVILIFVFSKGKTPVIIDVLYTLSFLVIIAVPVCINFYVLITKFLKQEQYIFYLTGFIANALIFGAVIYFFFQTILDVLFPSYFFVSYLSGNDLIIVIAIFLVSSTLFKLVEDWFYFNSNQNKLLQLKSLQFETQLSALRSQINPHFLFNSLNVIYALALDKKETTTKAIVELSNILRYVIYDSDTERVALKDEITLLRNYIAFQNHRINTLQPTILETSVENEDFKIYPMLLLPLVENSYKHGTLSGKETEPIKIVVSQKDEWFTFSISNPILHTKNAIEDKYSGVGLENLKNNLNLVYPNKHSLNIVNKNDQFNVTLTIDNELT